MHVVHLIITMYCVFRKEDVSFNGIKVLLCFSSLRLFYFLWKLHMYKGHYERLEIVTL